LRQIRYGISSELASGKIEESDPHSPNPETIFLDQEKVEIVKRAIVNKLPPFDGWILMSFLYGGMSVAEIARDANRSARNIYTRLAIAIAKIKEELDSEK
jgi:DNA-directed RNA polymerase specialized sigma24 family protein